MKIASTTSGSIVDGPGMRFTVFVQGCRHHCPGCHNPQTHPFDGGREVSVEELHAMFSSDPLITGLTLSGGDPMEQAEECAQLAARAKSGGHNVWTYTGYTYEQVLEMAERDAAVRRLLTVTNYLVDGRFEEELRDLSLKYRGSSNQRILDVTCYPNSKNAVCTKWS